MQPRTLYALIAAGLLLFTGSVFAQAEAPPATSQETVEPTPVATQPVHDDILLSLSPSYLWMEPGGLARIEVRIDSDVERTFRVHARPDAGLRAALSASDARAGPEHPATLVLKVGAPAEPRADGEHEFGVTVRIEDELGDVREQRATIMLRGPARPEPIDGERPQPVRPEPHGDPIPPTVIVDPIWPEPNGARPVVPMRSCARTLEPVYGTPAEPVGPVIVVDDFNMSHAERRFASILERIERRLFALEHPSHQPRPMACQLPPPTTVREPASITLGDAEINVPEDGRRVAVLLDGGDQGGRFRLSVHSRDDGWRYGLEKDSIALGPHQRTFVWLRIGPGETEASAYEVVASHGSTSLAAQGNAYWAGPAIV